MARGVSSTSSDQKRLDVKNCDKEQNKTCLWPDHGAEVELDKTHTSTTGIHAASRDRPWYWAPKGKRSEVGQEKTGGGVPNCRNQDSRDDLGKDREGCSKPSQMEKCHQWPMPNQGRRTQVINKTRKFTPIIVELFAITEASPFFSKLLGVRRLK
jgi:hypothetical protein